MDRNEQTIAEAEAFRAGRAEGYDEASKRSGARTAALEAEVQRWKAEADRFCRALQEQFGPMFDAGHDAAREQAAATVERMLPPSLAAPAAAAIRAMTQEPA